MSGGIPRNLRNSLELSLSLEGLQKRRVMIESSASEFRESLDFQGRKLEFGEKLDSWKLSLKDRQERGYVDRTGNEEGGLGNVHNLRNRNLLKKHFN